MGTVASEHLESAPRCSAALFKLSLSHTHRHPVENLGEALWWQQGSSPSQSLPPPYLLEALGDAAAGATGLPGRRSRAEGRRQQEEEEERGSAEHGPAPARRSRRARHGHGRDPHAPSHAVLPHLATAAPAVLRMLQAGAGRTAPKRRAGSHSEIQRTLQPIPGAPARTRGPMEARHARSQWEAYA